MAKPHVTALIMRDNTVEWTVLRTAKPRMDVVASGRAETGPAGAAEGEKGKEPDAAEALNAAVAALKQKCGAPKGPVTLGLPSDQILLRIVKLPAVNDDEIGGMARLQADKFSPFPIEQMVVSHEILKRTDAQSAVLIAAVREDAVAARGAILKAAGWIPVRVDAVVLGWWRLLQDAVAIRDKGRHAVLLFDEGAAELIVFQDGTPIFFRSLGASPGAGEEALASEMAGEIGYTLMSLELEHGAGGARSVAVWHRGEKPAGVEQRLRQECSCDVECRTLDSLPPVSEGLARRTASRDGAILDLTPDAWRAVSEARAFRKKTLLGAGVAFLAWALCVGGFFGGLAYEQKKLENLKAEQETLRGPAMDVRDTRRRVFMIQHYADQSRSALECLREVSRLLPEGVEMTSFIYRKGEVVKISGEASARQLVYDFKGQMDNSELFESATMGPTTYDNRKRKELFGLELILPGDEN